MASIAKKFKTDLRTAVLADSGVAAKIGARYYAVRAKQNAAKPYAVWSTISATQNHTHEGSTGLEEFRIQFSIYADTTTECEEARDALKDLLDGFRGVWPNVRVGHCFFDNEVDGYNPATGIHQKDIDFQFMVSGL